MDHFEVDKSAFSRRSDVWSRLGPASKSSKDSSKPVPSWERGLLPGVRVHPSSRPSASAEPQVFQRGKTVEMDGSSSTTNTTSYIVWHQEQSPRPSAGSGQFTIEGSNGGGGQVIFSRILQPAIPGAQENWRFAPGYQLITAQPPSRHSPFQNGDPSVRQIYHPSGGMSCVSRYPGCLSPRSYVESCAQIPLVQSQPTCIPIHMFSLRLGNFSSGVHQVAAASCGPSAAKRDPTACVFGRLAHSSFVTSTGSMACQFSHQGSPAPGLDHQLQQVKTPAQPNLRLHWHAVRHMHTHRGAPTQDASQSQQHAGSLEVSAFGHSPGPSQTLGDPKLYGKSGAKGQDAPPSHSVVGQRGLVPGGGALAGLGSGHPLSTPSGGLVGVPGCTPGRSTEYVGVRVDNLHRRLMSRMGCTAWRALSPRVLVGGPAPMPHQCARVGSCPLRSQGLLSIPPTPCGASDVRQRRGRCVHPGL